jgi:hypothetical protein
MPFACAVRFVYLVMADPALSIRDRASVAVSLSFEPNTLR